MNLTYIHDLLYNPHSSDNFIMIPQHITYYALYSAQLFLVTAFISYYVKYNLLATIFVFLYFSTLLHWYKLTHDSLIRYIDITLANISIIMVTYKCSQKFLPKHKKICYYSVIIVCTSFIINQTLFQYQVINNRNTNVYTPEEIEYLYYRCTFIHIFFTHIIPTVLFNYCAIVSYRNNSLCQ